jgi:hypothetical protein
MNDFAGSLGLLAPRSPYRKLPKAYFVAAALDTSLLFGATLGLQQ